MKAQKNKIDMCLDEENKNHLLALLQYWVAFLIFLDKSTRHPAAQVFLSLGPGLHYLDLYFELFLSLSPETLFPQDFCVTLISSSKKLLRALICIVPVLLNDSLSSKYYEPSQLLILSIKFSFYKANYSLSQIALFL